MSIFLQIPAFLYYSVYSRFIRYENILSVYNCPISVFTGIMQIQHVLVMIYSDHYFERALFHVGQLKAVPGKAAHSTKQKLRWAKGFHLKTPHFTSPDHREIASGIGNKVFNSVPNNE